nr:hypothetical protein Iba_chr12dCG9890 [Ipomoea batatas]
MKAPLPFSLRRLSLPVVCRRRSQLGAAFRQIAAPVTQSAVTVRRSLLSASLLPPFLTPGLRNHRGEIVRIWWVIGRSN